MRTVILPGVLRPLSDGILLAEAMRERGLARDSEVLDMFTGSGVVAIAAARDGASAVTAVDLAWRAVLNARLNAVLNGARVKILRGDLFDPVRGRRFDLVLANPPYVPSADDSLPRRGASLAWEGGVGGRLLLDRFCAGVGGHLVEGGSALIVQSSLSGEQGTVDALRSGGLRGEVLTRRRGPLGPVVSDRAEMLERQGVLDPGVREEELLVIRGVADSAAFP